jgi:hypothetical protein
MVNNFHQYQQSEQSSLNSDGIVRFVNISGIVDHQCLEGIVCFVDIGVNF